VGEYRRRRVFDQEFKRDAVQLVLEGGRRVRDVCRELGLHENVLHRWKNEYLADQGNAFPGKGHMKPHEEELMRLKKKVLDLEQEREILKKALAIFSKHPR
jgi:transposase